MREFNELVPLVSLLEFLKKFNFSIYIYIYTYVHRNSIRVGLDGELKVHSLFDALLSPLNCSLNRRIDSS